MKKLLSNKMWWALDLLMCSIWLVLLWHEHRWAVLMVLLPMMRILTSFLIHRKSKLAVAPLSVFTFFLLVQTLGGGYEYLSCFWDPFTCIVRTSYLLFGGEVHVVDAALAALRESGMWGIVNIVGGLWAVILPASLLIYRWRKGLLQALPFSKKRLAGLLTYMIVGIVVGLAVVPTGTNFTVMSVGVIALLGLILFYKGELKDLLSRNEILYLSVLALVACCYESGVDMSRNGSIVLCASILATYALGSRYFGYKKTLADMLLLILGVLLFWTSPTTVGMLRIVLLIASLNCVAIVGVRFALSVGRVWMVGMLFALMAIVMPLLSMGFNPYTAIDYKVMLGGYTHHGGIALVYKDGERGFRDRYGMICPTDEVVNFIDPLNFYLKISKKNEKTFSIYSLKDRRYLSDEKYDNADFFGHYKQFLKASQDSLFRIYDTRDGRLMSEAWFDEIREDSVESSPYSYRLKAGETEMGIVKKGYWDESLKEYVYSDIVDIDSMQMLNDMPQDTATSNDID